MKTETWYNSQINKEQPCAIECLCGKIDKQVNCPKCCYIQEMSPRLMQWSLLVSLVKILNDYAVTHLPEVDVGGFHVQSELAYV